MVRRESFPPNDDGQYTGLPAEGSTTSHIIEQAVERVVFSQSLKKPPGPDKVSFGPIRLLWMWHTMIIVRITKVAIRTG